MAKKCINPKKIFQSTPYGFSQIVVAKPGKTVYVSGQVAWDNTQKIVGKGNLLLQAKQSVKNLKLAIKAAGGKFKDIVMLRIYIVNYKPDYGPVISKVLRKNFGTKCPPASTWISVNGLANRDFMIEIEAQAII